MFFMMKYLGSVTGPCEKSRKVSWRVLPPGMVPKKSEISYLDPQFQLSSEMAQGYDRYE